MALTSPLHLLPRRKAPRTPAGGAGVIMGSVTAAIRALKDPSPYKIRKNWLSAVARLVGDMRPDMAEIMTEYLEVEPSSSNDLQFLSMGEIGVVYEALIAMSDSQSRREKGQYFTPDDVAQFMAEQSRDFPAGDWLDPCCGVGNLSFHLARTMNDPADFVASRLALIDMDPVALKTAVVLLIANFAAEGDSDALFNLAARSQVRDFLTPSPLPPHSYVIANPPYARTPRLQTFETGASGEIYAYFLERICSSADGFITITPASHLGGMKYASLREILGRRSGGQVLVFDNVPDTCFRGFKFGSTNSSKTNFVRASITISRPNDREWMITPIIRWARKSRPEMWRAAKSYLSPLRIGPSGEWAKIMPGTLEIWDGLALAPERLGDLVHREATAYSLDVASTPRYYISAAKRSLQRSSKHVLYFRTEADRDRAYVLLNSSLPYWWWRCVDGGVTLRLQTLLSTPVPPDLSPQQSVIAELEVSERLHLVRKLNAGRQNENVRRPRSYVERLDRQVFRGFKHDLSQVYASDMFAPEECESISP